MKTPPFFHLFLCNFTYLKNRPKPDKIRKALKNKHIIINLLELFLLDLHDILKVNLHLIFPYHNFLIYAMQMHVAKSDISAIFEEYTVTGLR